MKRVLSASLFVLLFAARSEAEGPPAPSSSPPPLVLTVTPGTGGGPWKIRVENTGDVPVRIAADPRVLVLDVTPPAEAGDVDAKPRAGAAKPKGPVRCALPADARPATDEGRELVVPGKRAWSASFDPTFYCFGARERAALKAGATVTARLGWPAPAARGGKGAPKAAPPFVAAPVGAAVGKIDPAKELETAPFTLAETVGAPPSARPDEEKQSLSLSMAESQDTLRGAQIPATVTLGNDGDRPATLLFRPTTLFFAVSGPSGSVRCGAPASVASPIRELFTTVGPKGRTSLTVNVDALCPPGTFDEPGVYRVTPNVDTTNASGRRLGIKSFDGAITGKAPMLLRVRTPRRPESPARPTLD